MWYWTKKECVFLSVLLVILVCVIVSITSLSGCKTTGKQFKITDTRTGSSVTITEDGLTGLTLGGTMLAGKLVIQAEALPVLDKKDYEATDGR